jgi:hypothetical protein
MMSGCGAAGWTLMLGGGRRIWAGEPEPQVRVITRGPKHHWFGYYDKWEFDPSDRYVLGMETDFEHRSPRADDEIRIAL